MFHVCGLQSIFYQQELTCGVAIIRSGHFPAAYQHVQRSPWLDSKRIGRNVFYIRVQRFVQIIRQYFVAASRYTVYYIERNVFKTSTVEHIDGTKRIIAGMPATYGRECGCIERLYT